MIGEQIGASDTVTVTVIHAPTLSTLDWVLIIGAVFVTTYVTVRVMKIWKEKHQQYSPSAW